jgi:Icc-related predicted phosphoesterase
MTELIATKQPMIWTHGHTHESADYMIGQTRLVCNPYGYVDAETNKNFDPSKTIEIT